MAQRLKDLEASGSGFKFVAGTFGVLFFAYCLAVAFNGPSTVHAALLRLFS